MRRPLLLLSSVALLAAGAAGARPRPAPVPAVAPPVRLRILAVPAGFTIAPAARPTAAGDPVSLGATIHLDAVLAEHGAAPTFGADDHAHR